ncbi:hypothetical protein NQ317_007712 [Molorchus minor]|uniref:Ig-like domain-containing protein n=1 Tax=Molorchus minor TaxID=1323400 RepID=A0ABQ9IYG0_9CUCU|nr:hypothetical protein NQ317_007712 [Molorchus minor]
MLTDIPEDGPVLRTEVQKIAPGAMIRANCTTPGSYPAMNITWFINDTEMNSTSQVEIRNSIFHYDALPGKETARSTISLRVTPELFKSGKMRLRCSATMFTLYSLSRETEIQEDAPQLALIMVPTTHTNEGKCT